MKLDSIILTYLDSKEDYYHSRMTKSEDVFNGEGREREKEKKEDWHSTTNTKAK